MVREITKLSHIDSGVSPATPRGRSFTQKSTRYNEYNGVAHSVGQSIYTARRTPGHEYPADLVKLSAIHTDPRAKRGGLFIAWR